MSDISKRSSELSKLPAERVIFDAPMNRYTSFKVGGPADALVMPSSVDELKAVLAYCRERSIPVFVMGNGTNLLVRDGGIRGVVIKIADCLDHVRREGDDLVAGAGISLHSLAEFALEESLAGLEFASGIPGTLGGAIYMNAGAYDGSMKDVICQVEAVDRQGASVSLVGPDIAFGYRDSALQQRDLIAVEARARLAPDSRENIASRMRELDAKRKAKQPLNMPSAGSTFMRPPGNFAGSLIEKAGLKGFRVGGAQVSCLHAGFVVNLGGATSNDILTLIGEIRRRVKETSGVELVPEVRIVGQDWTAGASKSQ